MRNPLQDTTNGRFGPIVRLKDVLNEFRQDWPSFTLTLLILAAAAWQVSRMFAGDPLMGVGQGGLSAAALSEGRWWTPLSSMVLHGGAMHLLYNLSSLIALGPTVSQRLGHHPAGAAAFFVFFLTCGLAGDIVFLAINPTDSVPMIGASGAIFGLWGAAARIRPEGGLEPILSQPVWRNLKAAVIMNLVLFGILFVLVRASGGTGGLAWEAHLGGFVAGLLLIGLPVFRGVPTLPVEERPVQV